MNFRVHARTLLIPTLIGFILVGLWGCSSTKLVKVTVTPAEAEIFLNGSPVGKGEFSRVLDFSRVRTYKFTAKLYKFADGSVDVSYKPKNKTHYEIKLNRIYSIPVPLVEFTIEKTATGLKPTLKRYNTIAYFDPLEPSEMIRGLVQVTDNKAKDFYYGGPVLSPTDDVFIYSILRYKNGKVQSQIWKQEIGSKATTRLSSENDLALFPTFVPDGTAIVYCSNRMSGKFSLWRRSFVGSGWTRISGGLTQDFSSSVSPNGAQIAYTGFPPDGEVLQIWTINIDGRLPTQLCAGFDPQISPDGKKILFLRPSVDTKVPQLWIMDFDGGGETQLTDNTKYIVKDARWSPDGKAIVFASNEGKDSKNRNNFDIWMMMRDGSKKTQLTVNGSHDDKPCFDRRGEQIFFRSNRGGVWNIWSFKLSERFSKSRTGFRVQ
ncbi:MAG: hypothetical protein D6820_05740 [Lentisphaerae bacterium]|nr:MAG: hypothetical protein D6820_05740 [Lentisphaerota bacterium]